MTENQIQKYDKQGLEVLGTTEEMGKRLALNSDRLKMVHGFIAENFREGIDFGPADPRNPKATLLKPGAEKVCKLFSTRPTWRMDEDTWKMLGEPKGTVCYLCEIVDNVTGEVVGEGRGAEKVGNKSRDSNKAIKAAEKCSIVDAALYTFGLSELFTQDGGAPKGDLDSAKLELTSMVEDLRMGIDSELTNNRFIHAVIKDYTKGSTLQTIGAVKAVRKAITDGLYDLTTGERVRVVPHPDPPRDVHVELDAIAKRLWGETKFLDELDEACHAAGFDLEKLTDLEAIKMIGELTNQTTGGKR